MQRAVELVSHGATLRGMEHIPDQAAEKYPAVLLFHGFTGNRLEPHRMFLKISRMLEDIGYASFRFDFMGSGESDGNFEDMTLSTEVADAHRMVDWVKQHPKVDAKRVVLLGLSMGGLVASLVAGDRPDDVWRLILMAPAGNMPGIVRSIESSQAVQPDAEVFDHAGNLVGRAFADDLRGLDVFPRAARYRGPVLLIHGEKDETVPYQVSEQYRDLAYGDCASIHIVPDANHTFDGHAWENEVLAAIRGFLA
ncbi:alpha/beta hydrolase family protein [Alicyclobacillus kakegawensis]|uniref:alpha/beta hydrolase family protein n=1 Tax=Alicyclobacillus kakegawensis TaxID=392012 RepID=UPI0008313D7F|nr:alpha/beta fold hydrolase [Alicyclobacillus kakegawensis]